MSFFGKPSTTYRAGTKSSPKYPVRTKTYIAFDGDADIMSYRTVQAWSADPTVPFSLNDAHDVNHAFDKSLPESIIGQLRKRLDVSKNFVLIVGSATNRNRKGILAYEIRYALKNSLPIILVFKGFSTDDLPTEQLWGRYLLPVVPFLLRNWEYPKYCLVCPFSQEPVVSAISTFSHRTLPNKGYTWWW